ncbi:MAG: SPFH domain-containing protein [Methylococcaceae bacterium]
MALFDGIKRQLRSVIEWRDPHPDALFQQWTDNGDEIKNASTLIVGPGQGCIFVYEGKVRSVLTDECSVNLDTDNIPFWTTITRFMQFFESEHKAAIYFFKTSTILDQKWGTTSVIKYEDPRYKFPVGLKAFGNFSYHIVEPQHFFVTVVGSHNDFFQDDFRQVLSARIVHPLSDFLASSQYSYSDIDANRVEIARGMRFVLTEIFSGFGLEITDFRVEGTHFDDETLKRINRIADLTAEAQAAQAAGLDYAGLQQLEAMREAARNEGGGAGMGMGLGAGISFGQNMAQSIGAQPGNSASEPMAKLTQLKQMADAGLISAEEYAAKKKQILDSI